MPPPKKPPKKTYGPAKATDEQVTSRSRGALLGLALGEALGIPNEHRNLPAAEFPNLNEGPLTEMRGGGKFSLRRGQVTWGSEMAQVLATGLRNLGRYDQHETAKAYVRWKADAFDLPEATKLALEHIAEGHTAEWAGRRVWLDGSQRVRDNGALARTAPIGVFFAAPEHRDARIAASLEDTAITHFAPLCQLASATVNGIIAAAICSPKEHIEKPDILKLAEAELSLAASTLGRKEPDWVVHVKEAADALREDVKLAQDDDPQLYGPELHLFFPVPQTVRVSFRLALWELFHAPSYEAGVVDVVNRGGDADTNAAITGALLGAVFGEQALPAAWLETVMEAPGPMSGSHWTVFHPRFLVTLAGNKPGARGE